MPMWHEDKELSKYNKYKVKKWDCSLARWGSVEGTALARVRLRVPVLALCAF